MAFSPPTNSVPAIKLQLPADVVEDIWCKAPDFWIINGRSEYQLLTRTDLVAFLQLRLGALGKHVTKSQLRQGITWISANRRIDHVIPLLSGYQAGIHEINGTRILVPRTLPLIAPAPGKTDLCDSILSGMLGPPQIKHFLAWFKIAHQCLKSNLLMPGQVVVFAGPQGCGKNLVQELIITPVLGGCWAEPYRYATGITPFNEDHFSAAHLMIADQKKPRDRADMQEYIRRIASNQGESLHPKFGKAISLPISWRLTVSCNLEEKDLAIIPPLDGLENKLMLFKCDAPKKPFQTETPAKREKFASEILAEIPALIQQLEDFQIPKDLTDSRYGVKGYQHPELVEKVRQLEPEERLIELLLAYKQQCYSTPNFNDVTAGKLHQELNDKHSLRAELYKICSSPRSLGRILTVLSQSPNPKITSRILHGETVYTVHL
jgi:hypothetical protein